MDWSDLPFFLAVAQTRQLARAAAILGSDATTVGRRVRRLEAALGERLFEQQASGQELTPAGIALLGRAEEMRKIASEIGKDDRVPVSGAIRVSVAEGFGTWFVSRNIADLSRQFPELDIDLVANSGFLNPTRRETDLAVVLARPRRGPLITRKLTDYALNLYASTEYLARCGPIPTVADLEHHPLIGYVPDIIYAPELRYIEELPISAQPKFRSSSINAQHAMIAAGAGLGVLPCFIGDVDRSLLKLLPEVRIERSFWLVTHRETHHFPNVRAVSDWLVSLSLQHRDLLHGRNVPD